MTITRKPIKSAVKMDGTELSCGDGTLTYVAGDPKYGTHITCECRHEGGLSTLFRTPFEQIKELTYKGQKE